MTRLLSPSLDSFVFLVAENSKDKHTSSQGERRNARNLSEHFFRVFVVLRVFVVVLNVAFILNFRHFRHFRSF
jgi:hypothetical protein